MNKIIISSIRTVLNDFDDEGISFVLCTSNDNICFPDRENILLLKFIDSEDAHHPFAFNTKLAERIKHFLLSIPDMNDLFICCDNGESRSSAIAAAILLSTNQSDSDVWDCIEYHPNIHVFRTLCKVLEISLSDEDITERKRINDKKLHNHIEKLRESV